MSRTFAFHFIFFLLGVGLIAGARTDESANRKIRRFLFPPPPGIEHFTFGYNELVADLFWLRLIQDIDYCEKTGVELETAELPPGTDPSKPRVRTISPCRSNKGWVFLMIDTVTTLVKRFYVAYIHGATILSVIVQDDEGARIIFERGIENYPKDWNLQYRAAFHYMDRLKQMDKAAELLNRAGENGAPPWVFALAARIYSKEGKAEFARSILEAQLAADPDGPAAERLRLRLDEVNAELESLTEKPNPPDSKTSP